MMEVSRRLKMKILKKAKENKKKLIWVGVIVLMFALFTIDIIPIPKSEYSERQFGSCLFLIAITLILSIGLIGAIWTNRKSDDDYMASGFCSILLFLIYYFWFATLFF